MSVAPSHFPAAHRGKAPIDGAAPPVPPASVDDDSPIATALISTKGSE
jgi:hypothetical protein